MPKNTFCTSCALGASFRAQCQSHEDEADQLAAMSGDTTTNDDEDDVPADLMPDDYDGLDQEDLLS